jgi:hypothetical protein
MPCASAVVTGAGRERDVADGLRKDAAHAEHDARAELRVAHDARDQLAAPAHHLGDEQA